MVRNMGNIDRVVRLVVSAVLVALAAVTGIWLLVIPAVIFTFTSLVSFCPIYAIFGLRTCPLPQK